MNAYAEKYKDPRWQKKRLEILERDGWSCQKCFDTELTLHVHHRRYISKRDPWDYPEDMLVTLCESCHETEKDEMQDAIGSICDQLQDKFLACHIHTLASGFHLLEMTHAPDVVASALMWAMRDENIQRELIEKYFKIIENDRTEAGIQICQE